MREFLKHLIDDLSTICPTYTHAPQNVSYPHIILIPQQIVRGLPWGPHMGCVNVKLWSRALGPQEILRLGKEVEIRLQSLPFSGRSPLKILESSLVNDGKTYMHTFRLKVRLPGEGV